MKKIYTIFKSNYKAIYLGLLTVIAAAMPHSRALMSSSMILLALIYILQGDYRKKYKILKERKSILIFTSIFLLHIIGIFWTTDLHYAFNDLKIKLPLLLFPIAVGTSSVLRQKDIRFILIAFTLSIFAKTVLGFLSFSGITNNEISDIHNLAGKFSHIRYALMLNISVLSLLWLLLFSNIHENKIIKILYILLILWFSIFIVILQSLTGWILFMIIILYTCLYLIFSSRSKLLKSISLAFLIIVLSGSFFYIYQSFSKYHYTHPIDLNNLELLSDNNNPYKHDLSIKDKENGHYVYLYICEKEMREEWNKISSYDYDGKDLAEQDIKYTLMRYLTSKGLRKDKEGIAKLDQNDIRNVEAGLCNYIFENKYNLYPKIYESLWQIEQYRNGKNPEGHSITQRIEFLKVAFNIIEENILFGVGTGDIRSEYKKMYKKTQSKLSPKFQLRAHNQFVTFTVMFGIIGFLWFMFAFIFPGIYEKKYKNYLFTGIIIILSISMLNEDTPETQMGAGIFALFYTIYLFYSDKIPKSS